MVTLRNGAHGQAHTGAAARVTKESKEAMSRSRHHHSTYGRKLAGGEGQEGYPEQCQGKRRAPGTA